MNTGKRGFFKKNTGKIKHNCKNEMTGNVTQIMAGQCDYRMIKMGHY